MVKVKEDITGWKMWEHGIPDSRLTVICQTEDYISKDGRRAARYLCRCSCGGDKDVIASPYDIRHGNTKSCGCLTKEAQRKRLKKYNQYDLSGEFGIGLAINTNNEFYFDLEDYEIIKNYCWCEIVDKDSGYRELKAPLGNGDRRAIHMHQLLGYDGGDHKDRNPFNNRRNNLRKATVQENNWNRNVFKNNTSGVMGVNYEQSRRKWRARICVNSKRLELGFFIDKEDAIKTRLKAEAKYFGEFAPQRHLFKQYGILEDEFLDE